jgi:hypothetical protein
MSGLDLRPIEDHVPVMAAKLKIPVNEKLRMGQSTGQNQDDLGMQE